MPLGSGNQGGGYSDPFSTMFGAASDLLGQQLEGETEEMKRRRQLLKQMQDAVSPFGASSDLGMTAARATQGIMRGGLRGLRGG